MRHQSLLVVVAGAALLFAASASARTLATALAPRPPAPCFCVGGGGVPIDLLRDLHRPLPPSPHRIRFVDAHRRVEQCGLEADGANLYYFDGARVMRDCARERFSDD